MSAGETPALPAGLVVAWDSAPPPRRGPRPSRSVDEIVDAAIRLADTEGLAAVSMPRVAAEVGLTQNALYRYLPAKDDLLVLLADTGYGTPPELPANAWRAAATTWTQALLDRFLTRTWLLELPVRGAPRTPGQLRWTEVLLQTLAGIGLTTAEQLRLAVTLDGYARSTAGLVGDLAASPDPDVGSAAVTEYLLPRLRAGGFPILAQLLAEGSYNDLGGLGEAEAHFGLERILDGVEAMLARRRG